MNNKISKKELKNINFVENVKLIIFFLVIVYFLMLFLDALNFSNTVSLKGMQLIFGYKVENYTISKFNVISFIGFLLPFIAIILLFINMKHNKIKYLIIALLFLISSIIFILLPNYFSKYIGDMNYGKLNEDVLEDVLIRIKVDPIFMAIKSNPAKLTYAIITSTVATFVCSILSVLISYKSK